MISAADQMRIARIEQQVNALERRLQVLENEIRRAVTVLRELEEEHHEYR